MNFLKKNQILLYVIAFMLVTAGYLNYTTKDHNVSDILQTTTKAEELAGTENIGDARLVNSQVNETNEENNTNTMTGAEPAASENGTSEENNKTKKAIPNLLNRLMYVMPSEVQLTSIQNSTSTHIVIQAQSTSYAQLGYLTASIKTNGILQNVISTSGQKENNLVTIKIEGDLPWKSC